MEILLVLALIALLAGVLIAGSIHLLDDRAATPEDVFWKACREAQTLAALDDAPVRLQFDPAGKKFTWDDGGAPHDLALPAGRDATVTFLQEQKNSAAVLLGGVLVETATLPFVTFYPDGTCTAFRMQLHSGQDVRVLRIDPWTCAPVLEAKTP